MKPDPATKPLSSATRSRRSRNVSFGWFETPTHHIRAVDDQRVDAIVRRAVVEHVDERVALAGEVYGVLVGIALAVQVENPPIPFAFVRWNRRVEEHYRSPQRRPPA